MKQGKKETMNFEEYQRKMNNSKLKADPNLDQKNESAGEPKAKTEVVTPEKSELGPQNKEESPNMSNQPQ